MIVTRPSRSAWDLVSRVAQYTAKRTVAQYGSTEFVGLRMGSRYCDPDDKVRTSALSRALFRVAG
jgi:hypothetical protein